MMETEPVHDDQTKAEISQNISNPLSCVLYNLLSLNRDLPPILVAMKRCRSLIAEHFGLEKAMEVFGETWEACDPGILDDVAACMEESTGSVRRICGAVHELKEYWGFNTADRTIRTSH